MWYKIKPFDTLFFRDGRPFTMGGETWANQIFPPYPSTIYGALRSWLIFEKGTLKDFKENKFKEELGNPNEKGSFSVKGVFLSKEDLLYFPIPRDLFFDKNEEKQRLYTIQSIEKPSLLVSDYPMNHILINQNQKELEEAKGWIDLFNLQDYLENKGQVLTFIEDDKFYDKEKKTGIKRNKITLNAEVGHLYRISMIRLQKNVNFYLDINGLNDYPQKGMIRLGGEGKMIKIEKVENLDHFQYLREIQINLSKKCFKIYFATPVIFKKGWIPEWLDSETLEGIYKNIKLKLIACALGKYIQIGGWDLANQKPKPMYRAVPAGSVYYFEVLDDSDANKIKEVFHLKNISDVYPEEGYGLSLVGGI